MWWIFAVVALIVVVSLANFVLRNRQSGRYDPEVAQRARDYRRDGGNELGGGA